MFSTVRRYLPESAKPYLTFGAALAAGAVFVAGYHAILVYNWVDSKCGAVPSY